MLIFAEILEFTQYFTKTRKLLVCVPRGVADFYGQLKDVSRKTPGVSDAVILAQGKHLGYTIMTVHGLSEVLNH